MKDSLKKKLLDQKTASIRIRAWKKKKKRVAEIRVL